MSEKLASTLRTIKTNFAAALMSSCLIKRFNRDELQRALGVLGMSDGQNREREAIFDF